MEEKKSMKAIIAKNVRGIVIQANELQLQKEDVLSLSKLGEEYVLIYFK
jgi:hypothetical protein